MFAKLRPGAGLADTNGEIFLLAVLVEQHKDCCNELPQIREISAILRNAAGCSMHSAWHKLHDYFMMVTRYYAFFRNNRGHPYCQGRNYAKFAARG